jgi:tagatose-1,6-bisphosphate aldolase non-catalytic subunit AgaZ/GatZ
MDNHFSLSNRIALYVPSTKDNKTIGQKEFEERTRATADLLSSWFGGATIETVQGFYKMQSGEYITEKINKIVSFCEAQVLSQRSTELFNYAHSQAKEWGQETIGLEIDSKFFLID